MKNFIIIIFSITSIFLNAQDYAGYIPIGIPPSPAAASYIQYEALPVELSSGIPSISVPIHQIQDRDISINISAPITQEDLESIKRPLISAWGGI